MTPDEIAAARKLAKNWTRENPVLIASRLSDTIERLCDEVERQREWVWMPHPGHFICAGDCRFHLNTMVNGYIVSTVGEYLPDAPAREIIAKSRGVVLKGIGDDRLRDYMQKIGYEDLGLDRKYETMVFKAIKVEETCCPWRMESGLELDSTGYNDAGDAYAGHLTMCEKWARNDH